MEDPGNHSVNCDDEISCAEKSSILKRCLQRPLGTTGHTLSHNYKYTRLHTCTSDTYNPPCGPDAQMYSEFPSVVLI